MALDQGVLDSWAPFWNTWIVFQALYFGANLALFYQRRHMQPIKFLQPMQLLTVNVFGALYGITLSTMYVEPRGSIFIKIVVPQMFLSAMCDMYALIAGGIMIAFSRTTEQLHLSNNRSPLESKQIARFIRISKIVLSQRFSAVFLISSAIIQLSLQTAYAMAHPNLIFATVADGFDEQTYVPEFISIGVKKIALDCAIFVFVAVKLRIVTDVHGIKANLKRAAICSIIGLTGFTISMVFTDKHETNRGFTVSSQLSNLLYTLVNFVAFTLTLTIPIVQTMQHRRTSRIQIEVHGDLEEFLRTPGGLAAFKKELAREFAIENVLFWEACNRYLRQSTSSSGFTETAAGRLRNAKEIHDMYLAENSPLEVNLDGKILSEFRELFSQQGPGQLRTVDALFRAASQTILRLMEDNFFTRFKDRHPELWTEFLRQRHENVVLVSISTT